MMEFSIHALLAESDGVLHMDRWLAGLFLSTLSLRRATALSLPFGAVWIVFYPRSPCGERPFRLRSFLDLVLFLSTLSLRRATYDTYAKVLRVNFSIHALLAESDVLALCSSGGACAFLSTLSLRRATPSITGHFFDTVPFLSTLSLRRATSVRPEIRRRDVFSIHALLAESD